MTKSPLLPTPEEVRAQRERVATKCARLREEARRMREDARERTDAACLATARLVAARRLAELDNRREELRQLRREIEGRFGGPAD